MGDEGCDFFLTWTHQSEKKQHVDRRVKGALLGQPGNFRDQFRRLHNGVKVLLMHEKELFIER